MTAFVARRAVQMVLSLWAAITLVFVAVTQLPGDPVRALFGFRPPPPDIYNAIRNQFHLDEPLLVQYWLYLSDVATGNWGRGFPVNPFGRPDSGPEVAAVVSSAEPVALPAGAPDPNATTAPEVVQAPVRDQFSAEVRASPQVAPGSAAMARRVHPPCRRW